MAPRLVRGLLLLPALALVACAAPDGPARDRFRGVRGDGPPPRPNPALAIADPPSAAMPVPREETIKTTQAPSTPLPPPNPENSVKPASYVEPERKSTLPWSPGTDAAPRPAPGATSEVLSARDLHQRAAARWSGMDSYIVRLRRREVVGGKLQPEELMMMKFRKQPQAVYFKWVGDTAKGREVVYAPGRYEGKIQTRLAAGDVMLLPAGMRFASSPDDAAVKARSRYPITEAGFGFTIARFGKLVAAADSGDTRRGSFKSLGKIKRPEFEQPVDAVQQTIPPGGDPLIPRGGQRLWCFDQHWHLPLLVAAQDERGREMEYYCYDRLEAPVHLDDRDFDPDFLWSDGRTGKTRGARP